MPYSASSVRHADPGALARRIIERLRRLFVTSEAFEIVGSFDSFSQDRFVAGWARDAQGTPRRLKIVVMRGADIVAEGYTDQHRGDGLPGFRIDTFGRINAMDIVERTAKVFGETDDGIRFGLPRHGPLIAQLMRRCFPPESGGI